MLYKSLGISIALGMSSAMQMLERINVTKSVNFTKIQPIPEPTPQPTEYSTHVCKEEGLNPDPNDCGKYKVCVPIDRIGMASWIVHTGVCPTGLHFDPQALFCNWPSQAQCNIN